MSDNTMTTAEASTKECCAFIDVDCSGPKCMGWRWARDPDYRRHWCEDKKAVAEPERPASVPATWSWIPFNPNFDDDRACWRESEIERQSRRTGYCGRAGPPSCG